MIKKNKIAFIGNSSFSMYNFRLNVIKSFTRNFDVTVIAPHDEYTELLIKEDLNYIEITIDEKGTNIFHDISLIKTFYRIFKANSFDLVVNYTIKPIIYGSFVCRWLHIKTIAITTGLGFTFRKNNLIKQFVQLLYRYSLKKVNEIWFLNEEDKLLFVQQRLISPQKTFILPSEGVNTEHFAQTETIRKEKFRFLLLSRLLYDKGIVEYAKAAEIIHQKYNNIECLLLGKIENNPQQGVTQEMISDWETKGILKYGGYFQDVRDILASADCIVLPSYYREGVPRCLMEAMSMQKPIITTKNVGCNELIQDEINGFQCQPKSAEDLASAMERMYLLSDEQRLEMGKAGRQIILDKFDEKRIVELYHHRIEPYFQATPKNKNTFNASIVAYNTPVETVQQLVNALRQSSHIEQIFLIDNSKKRNNAFESLPVEYIFNDKNIGYGAAHNIALKETLRSNICYHLVVNPDIKFDSAIFDQIIAFMNANTDVGALMPKVFYPDGELQYLCKLIPTPQDLFTRRFFSGKATQQRQERFELRSFDYNSIANIPFLSGCFMFLRTNALQEVGLFDERFHLYMEDVDLSRRIYQKYKTIFFPYVSIIHKHAHGSYKNQWLLWTHIVNSCRYFNKWGWLYDKERAEINKKTLQQLNTK